MNILNLVNSVGAALSAASVYNLLQCVIPNKNALGKIGSALAGIAAGFAVVESLKKIEATANDISQDVSKEIEKIREEEAEEAANEQEPAEDTREFVVVGGVKYYKEVEDERYGSDPSRDDES